MAFVWFADKPLRTREQIAREVHQVSLARNLDDLATVLALMCISVEVGATNPKGVYGWWCPWNAADPESRNFPHDSQSNDGRSVGYFQQQKGPRGELWWGTTRDEMTLAVATNNFLDRLSDDYVRARNNPQLAGQFVQDVQDSGHPERYATRWDEAWDVFRRAMNEPSAPVVIEPPRSTTVRPAMNEHNVINNWRGRPYGNSQSRNGREITHIVLHTSEGAGGVALVDYMQGAKVSYHTVVDNNGDVWHLVDTDRAAWSVGNANNYTINYCFGASRAGWTRQQWLSNCGNAIKIAAYLVAQDCHKYNIPPVVRVGDHANGYPSLRTNKGVTDHKGINYLAGGDHWDVGPNFPWDVFNDHLQKYYRGEGDDDMAQVPQHEWDIVKKFVMELHGAMFNYIPSQSIYRDPGEGKKWQLHELIKNMDGMTHEERVEALAQLGDEDALRRLVRTASGDGAVKDEWAVKRAEAALERVPEKVLEEFFNKQNDDD